MFLFGGKRKNSPRSADQIRADLHGYNEEISKNWNTSEARMGELLTLVVDRARELEGIRKDGRIRDDDKLLIHSIIDNLNAKCYELGQSFERADNYLKAEYGARGLPIPKFIEARVAGYLMPVNTQQNTVVQPTSTAVMGGNRLRLYEAAIGKNSGSQSYASNSRRR